VPSQKTLFEPWWRSRVLCLRSSRRWCPCTKTSLQLSAVPPTQPIVASAPVAVGLQLSTPSQNEPFWQTVSTLTVALMRGFAGNLAGQLLPSSAREQRTQLAKPPAQVDAVLGVSLSLGVGRARLGRAARSAPATPALPATPADARLPDATDRAHTPVRRLASMFRYHRCRWLPTWHPSRWSTHPRHRRRTALQRVRTRK
jgi:hypothetical protein